MPKIPTYDALQVRDQALPQVYQSEARADLIPALGNGRMLSKAGEAIGNLANSMDKMRETEDATAVFQAETLARDKYIQFQAEARKRQGINADGLVKDTEKFWEEQAQGANLTSDRQRELFIKRLTPLRQSSVESMGAFEFNQKESALFEGAISSMNGAIRLASENPIDAKLKEQAQANIRQNIGFMAFKKGWTTDQQKDEKLKFTNSLHAATLYKLVDLDAKKAQEYISSLTSDEMDVGTRAKFEGMIQDGLVLRTAQDESDKYEVKVATGKMTEQDVLQDISARFEGKAEEAVKMEYKRRVADQDAMREKSQKAAADEAWQIFERTGSMSSIPPSLRNKMDGRDIRAIKHEAQAMADRAARAADGAKERKYPDTNWDTYIQLREKGLAGDLSPDDVRRNLDKLGKAEREGLLDIAGKAKDPAKLKEVQTIDSQIKASTATLNLKGSEAAIFEGKVRQRIDAEFQGKPTNSQQRQAIIDDMLMQGEVLSGSIFKNDPNYRKYEVYGTPEANKFMPKDKEIIDRFTKRHGKPPTDAELNAVKQNLTKGN